MEEKSFGRGRILQDRVRVNVAEDIKMDDMADKMRLDGNIADSMNNPVVGEGGTSTDKSPTIKLKASEVQYPEQPSISIFEEKHEVSGNMQTCVKSSETLDPYQPEKKRTSEKEASDKPNESCKNQGTDQSVSSKSKKTVVPRKQKQLQYIDCPTGPIPATKIDAAEEFRSDVAIKDTPISKHFFCCVCGCPTGTGYYFMCKWNHGPVCVLCQKELSLEGCPVYLGQPGQMFDRQHFCRFQLKKIMSTFRDFMLENTIVGCRFRMAGCTYEGPWKKVKKHQQACKFDKKT